MATLDTLEVVVQAQTANAVENIKSLTRSLRSLRDVFKSSNEQNQQTINNFKAFSRELAKISKIDFSKVEKSLTALAEISKNTKQNISSVLSGAGEKSGDTTLSPRMNDKYSKNYSKMLDGLKGVDFKGIDISGSLEQQQRFVAGSSAVADGISQEEMKLRELEETTKQNKAKWLINEMNAEISAGIGKTTKKVAKLSKVFSTFTKKLTSRIWFRLTSSLIMGVVNIAKQAINSVYEASNAISGNLASSLDSLKSSFNYLIGAIGSIISPIVETLTPILTSILNIVSYIVNAIGLAISFLTGSDFVMANRELAKFNESTSSGASVGIDELNTTGNSSTKTISIDVEVNGMEDVRELFTSLLEAGALTLIISKLAKLSGVLKTITTFFLAWNAMGFKEGVLLILKSVKFEIVAIVASITMLIYSVKELIKSWDDMGTWQKIIGVFSAIVILLGTILTIVGYLTKNIKLIAIGISASVIGTGGAVAMAKTAQNGISFATGGFPEDGLFFANHNELVGKFSNGKTAVANNSQIIEGIKQGVMEAMSTSNGSGVSVYLDSKQIASRVENRINNKGATIYSGRNLNYGK